MEEEKIRILCECNKKVFIKSGKNYKLRCPFHKEKTASCTISPKLGEYHCFGCGKHGDFAQLMEQLIAKLKTDKNGIITY